MTETHEAVASGITQEWIVQGMQDKKALNVVVMNLKKVPNAVADFFVLASGSSDTHIDAIADSVEEAVYKASQVSPWRKEGKENREWILLDYVDVVVHIFKKDKREFYALEKLWGDAVITTIED